MLSYAGFGGTESLPGDSPGEPVEPPMRPASTRSGTCLLDFLGCPRPLAVTRALDMERELWSTWRASAAAHIEVVGGEERARSGLVSLTILSQHRAQSALSAIRVQPFSDKTSTERVALRNGSHHQSRRFHRRAAQRGAAISG